MKWKKGGMKRAREREKKNVLMLQSESVIKSVGALFKKNCYLYCFFHCAVRRCRYSGAGSGSDSHSKIDSFIYMWTYMKNDDSLFLTFDFFVCCSALIDQWVVFATVISECWMWGVKWIFEEFYLHWIYFGMFKGDKNSANHRSR